MRWMLAFLVGLSGCSRDEPGERSLDDAGPDWSRYGFVEMVPPLQLPTGVEGRDDVRVWLKLPPRGRLGARWLPDQQRAVLSYPAGTTAARVESFDGRVADVRGTELGANGAERFFVLRPSGGRLEGAAWGRGATAQEREATQRLAGIVGPAASERLRRQNDCAGCHVHARAPNRTPGEHGIVNRGTDEAGFFQIQTTFEQEAPTEGYKPRDPNVEAEFVTFDCGADAPVIEHSGAAAAMRCPDGRVPRARFDVAAALLAGDPRAAQLCRTRRDLAPFLDATAQRAFAPSLRACAIAVSSFVEP